MPGIRYRPNSQKITIGRTLNSGEICTRKSVTLIPILNFPATAQSGLENSGKLSRVSTPVSQSQRQSVALNLSKGEVMRHESKREAAVEAKEKIQRIAEYEKDVEMEGKEDKAEAMEDVEDTGKQQQGGIEQIWLEFLLEKRLEIQF